ncbi:MAG: large repetitive protein, partial [Thermoleophilaceae bacterium]|nr:large repetitive protein [Thermoleophilaceae bacterium]
LLNSGSGTFLVPAAHAPAVSNPLGITHGDFDRDGDQDLAVALSTGGNEVVIEVNNGTGTLTPGAPFGGFNGARDVAAGDADGDGILDLAVTNPTLSVVHGYQGVPASPGSFTTPPLTFPVGTSPWALTNGDLDRDGDLDLAVAIRGANAVTALLNDGSGSAGVAATFAAGAQPAGVATADLNGDGIPDVATANSGSNDVSVLRGTGSAVANSTFDVPSAFAAAGTAGENAIATGDFNNDGDPDVVTTDALYLSLRDPAAPSTTDDVPAAPVSGPRAVTLTAGDSGGSGLQTTYYEKSLSPPTPTTSSPVYDPNNKPVLFQGDTIKYFSTDRAGNREPVKTSSQLIVDAAAPPPPSGLATTPASPADDNAPRITGSAEAGSTVTIRSGACNGAVVATGTAAEFASPGLTVSVPDNTTTFFLATATDGVGNTSDCSAPVAYEEKTATPPPPPEPKKTANVEPKSGAVTVRCPGQGEATLAGDSQIQSGCRIDATDGVVTLTAAADAKGNTQSADFFDGAFKFKQVEETQTVKGKKVKVLITELTLDVAKPTGCTTKKAGIGTAKNGGHLWGRGKGRYRTRGRRGAGTVRGTEWLTEERCAGTFFQVKTGIVEVQDFTLKKTVLVKKGKTYLAPATKPAKKGKN